MCRRLRLLASLLALAASTGCSNSSYDTAGATTAEDSGMMSATDSSTGNADTGATLTDASAEGGDTGASSQGDSGGGEGGPSSNSGIACQALATPPSMGSCVTGPFMPDASAELDAGLDDPGNANRTTCNPVTNEGCLGTDVCGLDNSGNFYVCFPAGSPAGVAACDSCTAPASTCGAGTTCVGVSMTSYLCARMCCTNADCGQGTCSTMAVMPSLPSGVGVCTSM
jgi:hypothetical protein